MRELQRLLTRGLQKTAQLWPALQKASALVHEAAHLLANHHEQSGQAVREGYQTLLLKMRAQQASLGPLKGAITKFLKVTKSSWVTPQLSSPS
ncbi:MAG: hypothetical protein ACM3VW_08745 [Bacteroidota bacterium]